MPEKTFTDEASHGGANSELENAIECIAAYGIALGKPDGSYAPNERNSREQMATFIIRKLKLVTGLTVPAGGNKFANEGISAVHRPNVESAAATNPPITVGYSDGTFKATRGVARDEMATFIVRQLRAAGATVPAPSGAQFPDVDPASPHADNIRILRAMGIVQGRADGTYGPKDIVTRGNMSIFLSRDVAELVAQGKIPPFGGGSATGSSRPELVSAAIVQTTAQGTTIRYTFDEAVTSTGLTPAAFHVYRFDHAAGAPANTGGGDDEVGDTATIESGNTRAVLVTFTGITTTANAGQLSVATVDANAVVGLAGAPGDTNPEGDAGLNAGGTSTLAARGTAGPDLTSITNVRANPADPTQTLVDFVFDEAATNVNPAGYHLVGINGELDNAGTVIAGGGTTTHTVAFENDPNTGTSTSTITQASIARGYVQQGTVSDAAQVAGPPAEGNVNPLQAAKLVNSETPDLVSAVIARDQTVAPGTIRDAILFTFDEPVNIPSGANPGPGGAFTAYDSSGVEIPGAIAQRSTTNDTQVAVVFGAAPDALDLAVGASVAQGAVTEGSGNQNRPNQEDEVGVANVGTGPSTTSGRTAAPDLQGATVAPRNDPFGSPVGANVTWIFDEDVFLGDFAQLGVVLPDGTVFTCAAAGPGAPLPGAQVGTTEETDNQVTCSNFGPNATRTQLLSAVIATVDDGAVTNQATNTGPGSNPPAAPAGGGDTNPEGAERLTAPAA